VGPPLLLKGIIKPVFEKYFSTYRVVRADEIMQQGNISSQVINRLFDADLVIADMSLENANAFYELAIRHMKRLPTIHMIRNDENIPFDVFPYRAVKFSYNDPSDLEVAKEELHNVVEETIKKDFVVENPITHARGRIEFQEHATPAMKTLSDEIETLRGRISGMETELIRYRSPATPNSYYAVRRPPKVIRSLNIVLGAIEDNPDVIEDIQDLVSGAKIKSGPNDEITLTFLATDDEIERITAQIKGLKGVLEVDRK
jgi:hypothetical protein